MTVLYDVIKELNMSLRNKEINLKKISKLFNTANYMLELIGMKKYDKKLSEHEKQLYEQWNNAKANKDFELADKYRSQLIEKGVL